MLNRLLTSILIILVGSFSLHAQTIFHELQGNWEGEGKLFGQEAKFEMGWSFELSGQFAMLTFRNEFGAGKMSMNAIGYYAMKDPELGEGSWMDSRGMLLPLSYQIQDNVLTVYWGEASKEMGKTQYTLDGDKVMVKDFVQKNESMSQFGEATYTRVSN